MAPQFRPRFHKDGLCATKLVPLRRGYGFSQRLRGSLSAFQGISRPFTLGALMRRQHLRKMLQASRAVKVLSTTLRARGGRETP